MPKKLKTESAKEQSERFKAEVAKLIAAGELSHTEADAALDKLVRVNARPTAPRGSR